MSQLEIKVWEHSYKSIPQAWCYGRYYVGGNCTEGGHYTYLRNDGKKYPCMQRNPTDPAGGTYFFTQQEAQAVLDNYNAAQDETYSYSKASATNPLSTNQTQEE